MKCPKCKKEISYVCVYTEALRKGFLEGTSNRVGAYGNVRVLESTTGILCPKCGEDISTAIDE